MKPCTVVRFQGVDFWPATGHRDRPWQDEPEIDAWLKSARRVEELYSEALRSVDLRGSVSTLRLHTFPATDGAETVRAEVWVDRPEGWEFCAAFVPPAVAGLSSGARGRLVSEVVDAALAELGPRRGWPSEVLAEVREYVRARDLRFTWSSRWKASPNRRRQARASFQLADDGYGRVVIEVRDRRTEALVARSAGAEAYSTLAGFKRAAETLRWVDAAVEMVPCIDLLGQEIGYLRLDPEDGVAPFVVVDDGESASGEPALPVELVRVSATPESPSYEFGDAPERPVTRRTKDKLIARIHRNPETLRAAGDPGQLARADVSALLSAVGDKMGLGPPPDLRC